MVFFLINSINKGGAENQLKFFCDVLTKKRINYKIIYFEKSNSIIKFKNTIFCDKKSHISRIIFLYNFLKDKSPNSFILSFLNRSIYYASILNLFIKFKKSVAFFRSNEKRNSFFGHLKNFLATRTFETIYSNSVENQNFMISKYKLPKIKSLFIPNKIDLSIRNEVKNKTFSYDKNVVKVLLITRNTKVKNLHFLFKILDHLPDNFIIEILGKGFENSEFKRISLKNYSNRIIFTGFVKNPALKIFSASMLLSISKIEGTSNAIIESLTLGVPVVSSNVGVKHLQNMKFFGLSVIDDWNAKTYADELKRISKRKFCWINDFSLNNQKFENEVLNIVK